MDKCEGLMGRNVVLNNINDHHSQHIVLPYINTIKKLCEN